jgi:hypothetical protein
MMLRVAGAGLILSVLSTWACTDRAAVEEPSGPIWFLSEELRIGSLDDEYQAFTTPLALAVGPNGQVLVGQQQAGEISVFDSVGGFVRTIGRTGHGPGEFTFLYALGTLGDTLYAINRSPGRLSLFSMSGEHLSTTELVFPPPTPFHMPTPPLRLFPDGTGVVTPFVLSTAIAEGHIEGWEYIRVDRSGTLINRLFGHSEPSGVQIRFGADGLFSMGHPMPQFPLVAFSQDGSRMAIVERKVSGSYGARFGITETTLDGDTLHSTLIDYRPLPIPRQVADSIYARVATIATGALGADRERTVREVLQLPEHYPPATNVVYAADLSLWVRREARPDVHWEVYRDGRRVARVEVPRGLAVHAISQNALWGIEMDEFHVPYVVRYRIHRNGGLERQRPAP